MAGFVLDTVEKDVAFENVNDVHRRIMVKESNNKKKNGESMDVNGKKKHHNVDNGRSLLAIVVFWYTL